MRKGQTCMPPAGFEPAVVASEWQQTDALTPRCHRHRCVCVCVCVCIHCGKYKVGGIWCVVTVFVGWICFIECCVHVVIDLWFI